MVCLILEIVRPTVVRQCAGIWYVGVNAFDKGHLAFAADIIALPVAGTGTSFAPVLLHVVSVYAYYFVRRFLETGKVAAQQ